MTRACGSCTLCCRLVPVKDIGKPAGVRCRHLSVLKRCRIYASRPNSCRLWSCRWLVDDTTTALRRPDRAHYVIDIVPDFCAVTPKDDRPPFKLPVVQVWLDPAHPDAHRDPALRAWLAAEGEKGYAAIIRLSGVEAFVLWPPAITGDGFHEQRTQMCEATHSFEQVAEALCAP